MISPRRLAAPSKLALATWIASGALLAQDQYRPAFLKTPFPDVLPDASLLRSVDWNSDGVQDLALFGQQGGLTILINDGDGRFPDVVELPTVSLALDAEFADVDGDGNADLIRYDGVDISLSLQGGAGLAPAILLAPAIGPGFEIELGDLNGDSEVDVVLGRSADDIRWIESQGAGAFQPIRSLVSSGAPAIDLRDFRVEDVDGDGDCDLVAGAAADLLTWSNDGSAIFSAPSSTALGSTDKIRRGDLDGDGDLDRVVLGPGALAEIFRNDGGIFVGTGIQIPLGPTLTVRDLRVSDFDGDGEQDLLATSGNSNQAFVSRGLGAFAFDAPVGRRLDRPVSIDESLVFDADQDGMADLVFLEFDQPRLLLGSSDELLVDTRESYFAELFHIPFASFSQFLGQFDRDGRPDAFFGEPTVGFVFQPSAGRLETAPLVGAEGFGAVPVYVSGDFDGDGVEEFAITSPASSQGALQVFDVQPDRSVNVTPVLPGQAIVQLASADLNNDGRDDLLIDEGNGSNVVALSVLSGGFAVVPGAFPPGRSIQLFMSRVFADLNGDGAADILVRRRFTPRVEVLLNDGTGVFTSTRLENVTAFGDFGDLDGDGDVDVLNPNGELWLNDGSGSFPTTHVVDTLANGLGAVFLSLGDFDGDGDLDAAAQLADSSTRILFNLGGLVFEERPGLLNGLPSSELGRATDLDGDGDLDFSNPSFPAPSQPNVLNRGIDARAPWLPRLGRDFRIELASQPGYSDALTLGFVAIGFTQLPQPLAGDLSGFQIQNPIVQPPVILPAPLGEGSMSLPIDSNPALIGVEFVHQAIFLRLLPNGTFDVVVTSVLAEQIRR